MIDPSDRIHIRHGFSGLTIEIPAPRYWFIIVFMTIWLIGWLMGEVFVGKTLFESGQSIASQLFMAVWLIGWTLGGLFALYQIIWQLVGLEVITIEHQTMTIARNTPVWTRSKIYEISEIRNFRLVEAEENIIRINRPGRRRSPSVKGRIEFDYQQKTIKFGYGLNMNEAHRIMKQLKTSPKLDADQFA